jgi:hypothetical protein
MISILGAPAFSRGAEPRQFAGEHFAGTGDAEYLRLLDTARSQFEPNPRLQNLSMLYQPSWNGLVEGPTWDMWWIQNSYGTTYCWLPFMTEPWTTFLQNSQDLWFAHEGDGRTAGANGYVAPDGCLVDAANLQKWYYRQGDGRTDIHDWFMEATAAGVLMQSELLLISRDQSAISHYLPLLERSANFIETRRDPKTGLMWGGPACNLLAPSFAGYKKPDGSYGKAYHAGLQVSYIAALDRLIELEKLGGRAGMAKRYETRREESKQSLPRLITRPGYLINSIDPDGTKHGVFGAPRHGYFESSVNHDAVCFRVADDALARSIYAEIASIPQLRPHHLIIPNYPSYDDLYDINWGLWKYGYWTNGGHWSTCEARMIMGYYRLGHQEDARASMKWMLDRFASRFRMDNNLTDFGNDVYQPQLPINITYDAFGPSAAMIRGLFEYLYKSDRLVLVPHIPAGMTSLEQKDPIRFGSRQLYLSTYGNGAVSGVFVNGKPWKDFDAKEVILPYEQTPGDAWITILLGGSRHEPTRPHMNPTKSATASMPEDVQPSIEKLYRFLGKIDQRDWKSYEAQHAATAARCYRVCAERRRLLAEKKIDPLPGPAETAADKAYRQAADNLYSGFDALMKRYAKSNDPREQQLAAKWIDQ